MIRDLIDGATILLSNEYEAALMEQKTGWTADEILKRVGTRVVTLGAAGVRIEASSQEPIVVPAVPGVTAVEPTGVGDAFRSGFLGAVSAGLALDGGRSGRVRPGGVRRRAGRTQEYSFSTQRVPQPARGGLRRGRVGRGLPAGSPPGVA